MAPVYKLKFFDFMGVAEPIRYLFAYGGIKYENIVINKEVDWPKIQRTVPFGKLPVLEIDSKVLHQSTAICRYLAKVVGLLPSDDFFAAELDALVASTFDFGARVHDWYHEADVTCKAEVERELETEVFPRYLNGFEEIIQQKGGYLGGKQLTWADFYFVGIIESVQGMWSRDFLQRYPYITQLYKNVHAIPAVKNYIAGRPHYKY
ncbi:glutathione S-transferase isoform X1 [Amyelois transitella]|uniref:glutathione S-transferase isoform X1 n=1 Tax=Amyelois transitella TaxID=680683 RepID=UPI002990620E|nr:glutathione S-transferase isoform X1 [Amyelois transitella]